MEKRKKLCSEFKIFCLLQLHESVNNKCMTQTATESTLRLLLDGELDARVLLSFL